jgi:hypothetical protein
MCGQYWPQLTTLDTNDDQCYIEGRNLHQSRNMLPGMRPLNRNGRHISVRYFLVAAQIKKKHDHSYSKV